MSAKVVLKGALGSNPTASDTRQAWTIYGDLSSPVRITRDGLAGFNMPSMDYKVQKFPLLDGQRVTGVRRDARTMPLPMKFRSKDLALQSQFWNSMGTDGESLIIEVTSPLGTVRRITCRFADDGNLAYQLFPWVLSEKFTLTLVADDPWWTSDQIVQQFRYDTSSGLLPFFGTNGDNGPTFNIVAQQSQVGGAQVVNPGDVPSWPKWAIDATDPAGVTSFSFALGSFPNAVGASLANIPNGQRMSIDTNPTVQQALIGYPSGVTDIDKTRAYTNATVKLDSANFQQVPAGGIGSASIVISGVGIVTLALVPRYRRPF